MREETRCHHMGYSFRLATMHHPTDRITHTTAFVRPVVEHWLEREIARWVHHEESIGRPIAPRANAFTKSYISLLATGWTYVDNLCTLFSKNGRAVFIAPWAPGQGSALEWTGALVTTIHYACGTPMLVGTPGQVPIGPMLKVALHQIK